MGSEELWDLVSRSQCANVTSHRSGQFYYSDGELPEAAEFDHKSSRLHTEDRVLFLNLSICWLDCAIVCGSAQVCVTALLCVTKLQQRCDGNGESAKQTL